MARWLKSSYFLKLFNAINFADFFCINLAVIIHLQITTMSEDIVNNIVSLDIYFSAPATAEHYAVSKKLRPRNVLPLSSWDLTNNHYQKSMVSNAIAKDSHHLSRLAAQHGWNLDINSLLQTPYDALVVTDAGQVIKWASQGFTAMTGYTTSYAIGKTPKFLQGKNTSDKTRKKIKECLSFNKPFKGIITNYKKNREEYFCEVKIIPITNLQNEITHYIALEKEAV